MLQVGFFLHTPFPSSEYYRTLPYREQLLRGVLKADLIGFHIYDYARHFISSCTRILGLEGTPYGVEENGTLIRVAAFPIGINPTKFTETLREDEVIKHVHYLQQRCAPRSHVCTLLFELVCCACGAHIRRTYTLRHLQRHSHRQCHIYAVQVNERASVQI